jgi:hypothetical protein
LKKQLTPNPSLSKREGSAAILLLFTIEGEQEVLFTPSLKIKRGGTGAAPIIRLSWRI